jgi:hypothetical protein
MKIKNRVGLWNVVSSVRVVSPDGAELVAYECEFSGQRGGGLNVWATEDGRILVGYSRNGLQDLVNAGYKPKES